MKNLIILAACACFFACNSKKDSVIFGTLQNSSKEQLVLEQLTSSDVKFVDSVMVNENGEFSFKYEPSEPGFYRIRVSKNNLFSFILVPGETAEITGDAKKIADTHQIKGSAESDRLKKLNDHLGVIYKKMDSLNLQAQNDQMNGKMTDEGYKLAVDKMQALYSEKDDFIKKFIDEKPGSLASLAAVQQLNPETHLSYFEKIEAEFAKIFPNSDLHKGLQINISEFKKLAPGAVAPEIVLNDVNDKPLALSSLRGKIVLIDFWASWCGPCRKENPNVLKIYNKYKSKGFDIFGVSLDKAKEEWVKAIKDDKLVWNHVSDLKYWQSAAVPVYQVKSIPQTFLIDKEGKIIAKNLTSQQLDQKLAELFNTVN